MKRNDLQELFNTAKREKAAYIGVKIVNKFMAGPEYIINPYENIAQKLAYYNAAYDENCRLKANQQIVIAAAAYADTFEQVFDILKDGHTIRFV